ncbi:methylaspartate mutase [Actinoplanes sp. NPDC051343]|uniref:methylaspartate mutase n=1 Tax=Actinoplanes sp. NPDC051343 TaxID=3363906 RepID=UPI0037BA5A72
MRAGFGSLVRSMSAGGGLVVQPRMGFSDPVRMRAALLATKRARGGTVGTITIDAYTRVGDLEAAREAVRARAPLNGYPIVTHPVEVTRGVLAGVRDSGFPVQVRHGSAAPQDIFRVMTRLSLDATEGGPVSYCLPYGRTPLEAAVRNWSEAVKLLAGMRSEGFEPHLETFGGCMLGQLCPPSLLVAISVLEALFFQQREVRSVSVSYAQQTHPGQDEEAVAALRRLCAELLPTLDWHVVIYAYMGVYPATEHGAYGLLGEAARLAVRTGAHRLIVKTVAESRRIPEISENVAALEYAAAVAARTRPESATLAVDSQCYREARALVGAVLDLDPDVGVGLLRAFRQGYLDVPYCLHPDNQGRTRSYLDDEGRLCWAATGSLPIGHLVPGGLDRVATSTGLLRDLNYVRLRFDEAR